MKIGPGDQTTALQNLASNSRASAQLATLSKASSSVENLKGRALADIDPVDSVKDAEKWLGKLNNTQLAEFKETVKGVDFTAITQQELGKIGLSLFQHGLIGENTLAQLVRGNEVFDESGQQVEKDVPFNALELYAQRLQAQQDYAGGEGKYDHNAELGYGLAKEMVRQNAQATQVLYALSYFANSQAAEIGVDEKV
jgi:hypothetical protein